MKKLFIVYLIYCILPISSCGQLSNTFCISSKDISNDSISLIKRNSFDDTLTIPTPKLDSGLVGAYSGTIQKLYQHKQRNLKDFIRNIIVLVDGVEKICIQDSIIILYLIQNDSISYFIDAGLLNYSWQYYYFHDIYYSFFSYPQINGVTVYLNNEQFTILTQSGDFDEIYTEENVLMRKYYIFGLDYSELYINDNGLKCIYINEGKMIAKNNCLNEFILKTSE
ncbi:MAG: hypothetical protein GX437_07080 [Sphingobacteriales bacterium]|nr:hypothetical protein [Sphingobacteriales bacterium]